VFEVIGLSRGRLSADAVPAGEPVELAGRGTILAYDMPGPRGAPTLLLLHGLGATGLLNWFPAFGPLSEEFRVVAMDLRGHGRGLRAGANYRLRDCADDGVALMDALEVERCIAVGYSLGGPVAQLMWRHHRERVDGLVLCATSRNFRGKPHEKWGFWSLWGAVTALRLADALPRPRRPSPSPVPPPEPESLDGMRLPHWAFRELLRCNPAAMVGAVYALGQFSSHEWVGAIDVPTAVVVTLRDQLVSPSRQRKLARAIPDASVHEADTDHAACVLGARCFVPALVEACNAVARRLDTGRRVA
jgi:3-oxoadipate enol-lactonase